MANSLYAVIDTNVLVSALIATKKESHPLTVLANVFAGTITPLFNDEIISEYRDVLSREKFHLDPADIEDAINAFLQYGLNLERTEVKGEVFPDPKDVVFYEVKMSKEYAYLVTGNMKHFPKNPLVVTPAEMVDILRGSH
ncbi:MAG: putative toxin-antitoxin system toxin component, PIN family [Bacteroidales bacterium]|nr:putative toxin-antitoxin system toxin component, PIN family [Bacteroidales bacterium]